MNKCLMLLGSVLLVCLVSVWGFAGDGAMLVEQKCTACHDIGKVETHYGQKDKAGWTKTVTFMLSLDDAPKATDAEREAIIEWLAQQK